MPDDLAALLSKGDLRSAVDPAVIGMIRDKKAFESLISFLDHPERHVRMHAVDAIEKISSADLPWLDIHKQFILEMMGKYSDKEFRWHIAQIVSRLNLKEDEAGKTWDLISRWVLDRKESRIVRALSLQALFDLSKNFPELKDDLLQTISEVKREKIPSLNARIRKLGL